VQPWKSSSTGLVVEIMESSHVNSGFEATREQLREEQLAALSGLQRRSDEAGNVPCADCGTYRFSISDADGSLAVYSTFEAPAGQSPLDGVLDRDSLRPFLDTFDCYASGINPFTTSRDLGPQQWESAPVLSTLDSGCSHGIAHYACEDMRFWLSVEEPGQYLLSVTDCAPDVSLELLGSDMRVLASAVSAAAECPVIAYELTQPGTYGLFLHRAASSGSTCEEQPPSNQYRLRVTQAPR
jgi:hypothetical protein